MKERLEAAYCYDHLGGKAGHLLWLVLLDRGWVAERTGGERPEYDLTKEGRQGLAAWGMDLNQLLRSPRKQAAACIERYEGRVYPHLGAHLGKLVLDRLLVMGWFMPGPGRTLLLTELGRQILMAEEAELEKR